MAGSVIASGAQSLFAALAFSGSGYLFKMFDKNGYDEEIKRHNRATEELSRAKEAFYENETREKDRIQRLREELRDANSDIERTNQALDSLRKVQSITYGGRTFDREPDIGDFYKPSSKMKEYREMATVGMGVGTGLVAWWLL